MGIEDAPRDVKALRELSSEERLKLYIDLYCDTDGTKDPDPAEFKKWDAQKQADKLLTMLLKADQGEAGYVTIGVALPIRSTKQKVNQERWDEFTGLVSVALNELRRLGCQSISSVQFEGYGIVFTAFKPPMPSSSTNDRDEPKGSIPVVGLPPSVAGRAMMQSLVSGVKSKIRGSTTVKEAVNDMLAQMVHTPAPIIELVITALEEQNVKRMEGVEADIVPALISELRGRLQRQLS